MRPPEEVKRELVRQWLAKADEDMGLAEHLSSEDSPFLGAIGFHAQQAAEKYLKAFLTWHQVEFPWKHDIGELLDLVQAVDSALADSLREAIALTDYGVAVRYPGDFPEPTRQDTEKAVTLATTVGEAIRTALVGTFAPSKLPAT